MAGNQTNRQSINSSDTVSHLQGKDFLRKANFFIPREKTLISIRIDNDTLQWFKERGKRYQPLMNAVLRAYMEAANGHNDKQ